MPDSSDPKLDELALLVTRYLEGELNDAELAQFDERLQADPDCVALLRDFSFIGQHLQESAHQCETPLDDENVAAELPARRLGEVAADSVRRLSTRPLVASLMIAGLVLGMLLTLMAYLFPPAYRPVSDAADVDTLVVARLTGTSGAQWAQGQSATFTGAYLARGHRLQLQSGLVEVTFNNGTFVVVEGPAELQLTSADAIRLSDGQLVAHVPPAAVGFTVNTQSLTVKDLGTEFGVMVGDAQAVDVAVYAGRVEVARAEPAVAGEDNQILRAGQTFHVDVRGATTIGTLQSRPIRMARGLPAKDLYLDLADILAGGDGTSLSSSVGLSLPDGAPVDAFRRRFVPGDGKFTSIATAEMADGLFLLRGQPGEQQVTSAGHVCAEFPANDGRSWGEIWAWGPGADARLGNGWPGELVQPRGRMIALHPNAGITIDLRAVRAAHSQQEIRRFFASLNNEYIPARRGQGNLLDVWILVDGKLAYSRRGIPSGSAAVPISVPLQTGAQFLTLATTDGGDGISCDFAVFHNAKLELASAAPQTGSE